jgi:curli production assembly/transport component CsgF
MARSFLWFLALVATTVSVEAGQLQYQPVNPNFGGNPLNGQFLFQQATANNHFLTAPNSGGQSTAGTTQDFNTQVRNSLLSALESQAAQIAVNAILGTNGQAINQGSVNLAGELIQFQRNGGQISINLTDTTTGSSTQISVPVPQF